MDIYARAGKHDQVERMSQRLQLDSVQLSILIKSLGKADKADRATAILKGMLGGESRVKPDAHIFILLVNAWAKSSQPYSLAQAYFVIQLMNEDLKCIQLGIRPDTVTFSALLK